MSIYVVYDTLLSHDATAHCRKIRVDKCVTLEEAKRLALLRFIRFSRGPHTEETDSLERITVETTDGEIVFELPSASVH